MTAANIHINPAKTLVAWHCILPFERLWNMDICLVQVATKYQIQLQQNLKSMLWFR